MESDLDLQSETLELYYIYNRLTFENVYTDNDRKTITMRSSDCVIIKFYPDS